MNYLTESGDVTWAWVLLAAFLVSLVVIEVCLRLRRRRRRRAVGVEAYPVEKVLRGAGGERVSLMGAGYRLMLCKHGGPCATEPGASHVPVRGARRGENESLEHYVQRMRAAGAHVTAARAKKREEKKNRAEKVVEKKSEVDRRTTRRDDGDDLLTGITIGAIIASSEGRPPADASPDFEPAGGSSGGAGASEAFDGGAPSAEPSAGSEL